MAARWNLGVIHLFLGRFEEAIEAFTESVELSNGMPQSLALLAYTYSKSGDEAQALATLAQLEGLREPSHPGYAHPVLIAYVYEGLEKPEDALHWLEQALTERDGWLIYINFFPRFESLRDEPRFKDILLRLGLPEMVR